MDFLAPYTYLFGCATPRPRLGRSPAARRDIASEKDFFMTLDSSLTIHPATGYAGDIPALLAWQWLQAGQAVLVDVRTDAEREWVGRVPGAVALAWKQWPGMALNPGFDAGLQAAVPAGQKVVLLCRSGVRSVAAARRAAELGLEAYNILEGFEGDADEHGQRGHRGGWRCQGLPWQQG